MKVYMHFFFFFCVDKHLDIFPTLFPIFSVYTSSVFGWCLMVEVSEKIFSWTRWQPENLFFQKFYVFITITVNKYALHAISFSKVF